MWPYFSYCFVLRQLDNPDQVDAHAFLMPDGVCVCVALESGTISHRRSNGINCFIIKLMKHIGKVYGQPMIDSYVEYACARAALDESV